MTPAAAPRAHNRTRLRTGLTVLEVVVALAIVSMVAGMLAGAIGLMQSYRSSEQVKLAAYEAAHRLIVQFNEDPIGVAEARFPVEVDGYWFDYDVQESVLRIDEFAGQGRVQPTSMSMADLRDDPVAALTNPLWRVEVAVFATEPSAGFQPGDELARLSRVYSLFQADPDALYDVIVRLFGEEIDRQ